MSHQNTHLEFPIIGRSKLWYALSGILLIPGIISLFVWGLPIGIDFRGGTMQQLDFTGERPAIEEIRQTLEGHAIDGTSVQTAGEQGIIVRFPNQDGVVAREAGDTILKTVSERHGKATERSFQTIGGSVAESTTNKAFMAVGIAAAAIALFIAWSFRHVPASTSSWKFSFTTLAALIHDIVFVLGTFSLLGHFFHGIEADALFITAMLIVLGVSVNDTIVVYDRLRENLKLHPTDDFAQVANSSANQTLARSMNTSATIIIVLLAMLLLGGESIRNFILALTLGVSVGAYSSIFTGLPLLVHWQQWSERRASRKPRKKKTT